MSGPLSLPDDTIEFDVDRPSDRPVGLMIGIGVLTLLVLAGLGYLVFGNLTGGGDGSGVGLGGPGGPPAIGGPSDSPSPQATSTTTAVPIGATTPATTPTHPPTPSASSSAANVGIAVVNGIIRPQNYIGPACPASTTAQATVLAGGPVTITYRWNYTIDGKPGALPPAIYQFTAAGSHQFSYQPPALAEPSGKLAVTFVVTAPTTRRASMLFTQECGAKASGIVMTPAHPKCGTTVTLTSTMSAGVGPMTISYRWRNSKGNNPPNVPTWPVPVGGGQQDTTHQVVADKDQIVTLTLDRISPPSPTIGALRFQTAFAISCQN